MPRPNYLLMIGHCSNWTCVQYFISSTRGEVKEYVTQTHCVRTPTTFWLKENSNTKLPFHGSGAWLNPSSGIGRESDPKQHSFIFALLHILLCRRKSKRGRQKLHDLRRTGWRWIRRWSLHPRQVPSTAAHRMWAQLRQLRPCKR